MKSHQAEMSSGILLVKKCQVEMSHLQFKLPGNVKCSAIFVSYIHDSYC